VGAVTGASSSKAVLFSCLNIIYLPFNSLSGTCFCKAVIILCMAELWVAFVASAADMSRSLLLQLLPLYTDKLLYIQKQAILPTENISSVHVILGMYGEYS
jgi:hypothetical protein